MDPAESTFLIASPSLDCPFFSKSIVLLVNHDESGSFGFSLHEPAERPFSAILKELNYKVPAGADLVQVVQGGPVSPESGWVVFDPKGAPLVPADTLKLSEHLAITASLDMLDAMSGGAIPKTSLLALGYCGWSEGQLEQELRSGSWIAVDLNLESLLAIPAESRWEQTLKLTGIQPWTVLRSQVALA